MLVPSKPWSPDSTYPGLVLLDLVDSAVGYATDQNVSKHLDLMPFLGWKTTVQHQGHIPIVTVTLSHYLHVI